MKSVLHIYKDYYPPVVGGIEKTINLMCTGLKDDYDVKVLVANRAWRTETEVISGVEVIKAGCLARPWSAPLSPSFPRLLKKYDADILHFHCPNPMADMSYFMAKPKGKVVVTYHSDVVRQRWAMFAYDSWLRRFLDQAQVVMPTSPNYIKSSPYLRRVAKKCRVVPLGIPTKIYERTPGLEKAAAEIKSQYNGKPLIVFVGLLRYYKGLRYLIQAIPRVDAHFLIIGAGPERKRLEHYVRLFKVSKNITFLGMIDDQEKLKYLYAADIFCLPSHLRSEAFGICQLEAMACGLPVISTALDTGVPFVNRNGETGLVVEPGSSQALAEAINYLLKQEQVRKEMGQRAQERVYRRFSAQNMIIKIKQIYEGLK